MIRVTVELIPYGIEAQKETLGVAHINNDGTGTRTQGNYRYTLYGKRGQVFRDGAIVGFPRLKLGAWDLLFRVLRDCMESRNNKRHYNPRKPAGTDETQS